jgi:pSer/pThr/pTyr-binding forkhead associated (FHA) protein
MELTLKLLCGSKAGQEIKIPVNKFLIGRADDCHLRPHSDTISRHHCVLLVEEGFCAVRDFGSRNGTLVNEEKIVGQHELRNGDRLKIGSLEFEVQLSSSVGGKKRPKVKDVKDAAQRTAAGPVSNNGDDDISDWLTGEGNDETRRVNHRVNKQTTHDTATVASANRETTFMKTSTDETTTVAPLNANKAPAPAEENAPRGADAAKRLFGAKLAAVAKEAPKDSHEAATQALKRLFNNRKM